LIFSSQRSNAVGVMPTWRAASSVEIVIGIGAAVASGRFRWRSVSLGARGGRPLLPAFRFIATPPRRAWTDLPIGNEVLAVAAKAL